MDENRIFDMAERLHMLRNSEKDLKKAASECKEEIDQIEQELVEAMTAEEMQNFTRNGRMYYLNPRTYVSPVVERKEDLHAWLKENGYGDMVKEQVNNQTLGAFVREQLEESDELPGDLGDLVNIYEKTGIGIRKAK